MDCSENISSTLLDLTGLVIFELILEIFKQPEPAIFILSGTVMIYINMVYKVLDPSSHLCIDHVTVPATFQHSF